MTETNATCSKCGKEFVEIFGLGLLDPGELKTCTDCLREEGEAEISKALKEYREGRTLEERIEAIEEAFIEELGIIE